MSNRLLKKANPKVFFDATYPEAIGGGDPDKATQVGGYLTPAKDTEGQAKSAYYYTARGFEKHNDDNGLTTRFADKWNRGGFVDKSKPVKGLEDYIEKSVGIKKQRRASIKVGQRRSKMANIQDCDYCNTPYQYDPESPNRGSGLCSQCSDFSDELRVDEDQYFQGKEDAELAQAMQEEIENRPVDFIPEFSKEDTVRLHGLGIKASVKVAWDRAVSSGHLEMSSNRYVFSNTASDKVRAGLKPIVAKVNRKLNRLHIPKRASAHEAAVKVIAHRMIETDRKFKRVSSFADSLMSVAAAAKPRCPHCGSKKYALLPTDFETAKCDDCGKNWDHGIVKGVNDPSEGKVAATTPRLLYHGTSLVQLGKMQASNFEVSELYLGEDIENICGHYAEEQAKKDDSSPVYLTLDASKLDGLKDDFHEDEHQLGQYIFTGNLLPALVKIEKVDVNGEEVDIPIKLSHFTADIKRMKDIHVAAVATPPDLDVRYNSEVEPGDVLPEVDEIHYIYYGPEYVDESPEDSDYYTVVGFKDDKGLFNVNVPAGRLKEVVGEHLAQRMALGQGEPIYPPNTTGIERPFKSLVVHDKEFNEMDLDWLKSMNITASRKTAWMDDKQKAEYTRQKMQKIKDGHELNVRLDDHLEAKVCKGCGEMFYAIRNDGDYCCYEHSDGHWHGAPEGAGAERVASKTAGHHCARTECKCGAVTNCRCDAKKETKYVDSCGACEGKTASTKIAATYPVVKEGNNWYIKGLPSENYDGGTDPDSMILPGMYYSMNTPNSIAEGLYVSLYDELQTNDHLKEGDIFETQVGQFIVKGVHVFPHDEKARAAIDAVHEQYKCQTCGCDKADHPGRENCINHPECTQYKPRVDDEI